MRSLHIHLCFLNEDTVELRYYSHNPHDYRERSLPVVQIEDLIQRVEQDYYTYLPVDYIITGKKLYNWLDGSDRWLQRELSQSREDVVLAIATSGKLAHLPWEILHDGNNFLVERLHPAIVPVRWVSPPGAISSHTPANRALQVLFMASSPLDVDPVLDFEREEGRILEATARQPLVLTVEESGCLSELRYLVENYKEGDFDVLHLTGHATIANRVPQFLTETETGDCYRASAEDIAEALRFRLPPLMFLSGCRTGEAGDAGAVPSMAENLLQFGARAVLGWGRPVDDRDATEAAASLYRALSAGYQIAEALAITYRDLIKNKDKNRDPDRNQTRDWHLLRLYVADTMLGALVTSPRQRKAISHRQSSTRFLDAEKKVKVASRESFVGRRRQIQKCLRTLTQSADEVGVLIYGMGGLGKSTLAARLCDRLPNFEMIVLVGKIDEAKLVKELTRCLDYNTTLREILQAPNENLEWKLRQVFRYLEAIEKSKPLLLVLDDFELNLSARDGGFVPSAEAAEILEALVSAIWETQALHRLIITSRYEFEFSWLRYFYKQPLDGMRGADWRKKCDRLPAFNHKSQVSAALQTKAKTLADGNPRLLEWMDKLLQDATSREAMNRAGVDRLSIEDVSEILTQLEGKEVDLREKVLAKALLDLIDGELREMLELGLMFDLPVPPAALATIGAKIPQVKQHLERAIALGLLSVGTDDALRVPRILPLPLREYEEVLYRQAAELLYRFWWEEAESASEEQRVEIHRLALLGKAEKIAVEMAANLTSRWNNQSRFREAVKTCQDTLDIVEDYRIFHRLAAAEVELGDVDRALVHYQQALDSCPPEEEQEKAAIIHNLAGIYANRGEVSDAIAFYQQSLELFERIGNLQGKAATLHCLVNIYANRGDVEDAIAFYQQSLELNERIGDVQGKAATLHCLANIYANRGEVEDAIAFYQQSLELKERIGDVRGKAATLHQLAGIYANRGEVEDAIAFYQQSLELKERIGDVQGKAATLHQMAGIYANRGEVEDAIAFYQQSLELFERIGNLQGKAATLHCLANIYANRGDVEDAIAFYQQSLDLEERIGNLQGKAATLHCLANIYANRGDVEDAIAFYQQSLELNERIGDVQGKAATLHCLANIYANRGEVEDAIAFYQQSLELNERIGDVQGKAATLAMMGQLLADELGEFETALNYLQQSLEILQRLKSPDAETVRKIIARVKGMVGI